MNIVINLDQGSARVRLKFQIMIQKRKESIHTKENTIRVMIQVMMKNKERNQCLNIIKEKRIINAGNQVMMKDLKGRNRCLNIIKEQIMNTGIQVMTKVTIEGNQNLNTIRERIVNKGIQVIMSAGTLETRDIEKINQYRSIIKKQTVKRGRD